MATQAYSAFADILITSPQRSAISDQQSAVSNQKKAGYRFFC
jgi:hypothetical protein